MALKEQDTSTLFAEELQLGTWSDAPTLSTPIAHKIDRREFLRWLLLSSGATAAALTAPAIAHRLHENATWHRGLSEAEKQWCYDLIRSKNITPEVGFYPDFENRWINAWGEADRFRTLVGQQEYIGFFSTLQQMQGFTYKQALIDSLLIPIMMRKAKPVMSLGLWGRGLHGHPFHRVNLPKIKKWIDKSAQKLSQIEYEMDVRFLFEMNLFHGFVAYKKDGRITDEAHQKAFKELFEYFYERLQFYRAHHIHLAFCPSAHGLDFRPYLPAYGVEKIGMDLYDMFEGKNTISPFNLLVGTTYPMAVFEHGLEQLIAIKKELDVPMYLYELGSLTKDEEWLEAVILLFLAAGGSGSFHFNPNKQHTGLPEETNWNFTPAIASKYQQIVSSSRQVV